MNKNIVIVIAVVVGIIIAGAFVYSGMKDKKSEEVVKQVLEQPPVIQTDSNKTETETNATNFTGKAQLTPAQTKIAWTASKTLVVGYKDSGSINIKSGEVEFINGKIQSAKVILDMPTITALTTGSGSGQDSLSTHLKSADFFDVEKFPTAEFNLTEATQDPNNSNKYTFKGNLNMKGINAPVSFPGTIAISDNEANLQANFDLDRTIWGINFGSSKVANSFIDDKFNLQMNVISNLK